MGRKLGGSSAPAPFLGRGAGSPSSTMWPGPRPTSVLSAVLIHLVVRPQCTWAENWGGPPPLFGGKGSWVPSNTKSHVPSHSSVPSGILIHPAIWPQQIWAENWGLRSPLGRGAGSPSNTMWPGPKPTCMPNVWPQYSNVADRTDRQDRQTDRQRSDSIGRTVLQKVAQKAITEVYSSVHLCR